MNALSPTGGARQSHHDHSLEFPVVAVGASAGGLEAFTQLLRQLPDNTGMAFVFIQHMDPRHTSTMPELLGRVTAMPVTEAANGQRLEPNRVFVIPSDAEMSVSGGVLRLFARPAAGTPPRSIDQFFSALAQDQGSRTIGVILSATGSDGTAGLRAILAEGGITFAQDEQSAKFSGMLHSAAAAGAPDFVLPPEEIGQRLAQLREHLYANRADWPDLKQPGAPTDEAEAMRRILALLKSNTGIDFTAYRQTGLGRRIQRRMMLTGIPTLSAYAAHLQSEPAELANLHTDMFIHVTSFFRDGDIYETLQRKVFPKLAAQRGASAPVRIWVPGCSTSEEAYSLAITWLEFNDGLAQPIPLQLFGTDISAAAIEKARAGRYPESIAAQVSPSQLERFLVQIPGGYQIAKPVRDRCVFAPHDLLRDPPFTQLDLLCCRNVLIYLETDYQNGLLQLYHYALRPTGFLVLGLSESIGKLTDLFSVVDKKHHIFSNRSNGNTQPPRREPAAPGLTARWANASQRAGSGDPLAAAAAPEVWAEADRVALARYAPPGVVISENLDIVQYRGRVGTFLEPAPGQPSRNLTKMARAGLQLVIPGLVRKAQKSNAPARLEGVRIEAEGAPHLVSVEVTPLPPAKGSSDAFFLVSFEEQAAPAKAEPKTARGQAGVGAQRLARLQPDLDESRENLQLVIAERDANNEELTSALEELQSGNEELQSTNEVLQTTKEELQSTNEELTTLNEELENRNHELSQTLSNLNNVVDSVRIPIVIVGGNRRIRLFNAAAKKVLNIVATDNGRLIDEVRTRFDGVELETLFQEVMRTLQPYEQEVPGHAGDWYVLRIRPYRSLDNKIDGAVLTWSDISALKASLLTTSQARDYLAAVVATMRLPLLVLDADLRVQTANQAFYDVFQVQPEATEHRRIYELGQGQWNVPELRQLLEDILPPSTQFHGLEIAADFPGIGPRTMLLNARRVEPAQAGGELILLAIDDISAIRELMDADQVRHFSGRLQAVREEERTSLSRELHDELGGALTGLKIQLHQLRKGLTADQVRLDELTVSMADEFDVRTQAGEIRQRTGALLEQSGLYERLSAEDNLEFYARIWRMPLAERQARIGQLLEHFGLRERRKERVGTWSRGMRQKLAIVRALLHRPRLIFLDEPTAGLDPQMAAAVRADLITLAQHEGVTVFLTTHDLAEAEKICQWVAVIRQGKLLAVGRPDELRKQGGASQVEIIGRGFTPDRMALLRARPEVAAVTGQDGRLVVDLRAAGDIAPLTGLLVRAGAEIEEVGKGQASLEDVFMSLMQEAV